MYGRYSSMQFFIFTNEFRFWPRRGVGLYIKSIPSRNFVSPRAAEIPPIGKHPNSTLRLEQISKAANAFLKKIFFKKKSRNFSNNVFFASFYRGSFASSPLYEQKVIGIPVMSYSLINLIFSKKKTSPISQNKNNRYSQQMCLSTSRWLKHVNDILDSLLTYRYQF